MNITNITTTNGDDQFYPTPPFIARKMLTGINWDKIETILEPSAGKGDLIRAAAEAKYNHYGFCRNGSLDVDAVEIDPYLREICKYNFSGKLEEYKEPLSKLQRMAYGSLTVSQQAEKKSLEQERDIIKTVDLHIVHDDFMTYRTHKHYDLILMNPPFADGDMHLLKALEMQKDGGMVVCLLNAETVLNPYTKSRAILKNKLNELNAKIDFMEDAFSDAERRADVNVAIIRVEIPAVTHESTLFERMKKAAKEEHIPDAELRSLVPSDRIEQAICLYNAEVSATMELIKEYKALIPYMTKELGGTESYGKNPILSLVVYGDGAYSGLDIKKYMRMVRLKYWKALFKNDDFTGRLTSNLRKQFQDNIDKMADYEFSAFNIKQVMVEMNASMTKGVQETIMNLFEKLTQEHSWYPECAKTIHYYNGWKTNKAHKIGKKAIIPANGIFSSYTWRDKFDKYAAYSLLSDIEKAFDYLDGGYFKGQRYNLESFLSYASETGQTRNIDCTYFKVDLFKKGTVHIKFKPEAMPLVNRLNIYAAQGKGWLPPHYGKKAYSNMDTEEKAVVDGLNGDGTEGSGEKDYQMVMAESAYYLTDPTQTTKLLA